MKLRSYIYLSLLSSVVFVTACSTQNFSQKSSIPGTPASDNDSSGMEGGIVGTGNEDECKHSDNKEACNDNVK